MSQKVGPITQSRPGYLWMRLCLLLGALLLAKGSTLTAEDLQNTATVPLPEDWTGTTVQLQPDLQTEAQTQTEAPTEALTETPAVRTTGNYTGESVHPIHSYQCQVESIFTCVQKVSSQMKDREKEPVEAGLNFSNTFGFFWKN